MRNTSITFCISTLLFVSPVMAGAGHEHGPYGSHSQGPINSDAVIKKAETKVTSPVKSGKLDKSLVEIKAASTTQKTFGDGGGKGG